jgi:hypothetical protein
LTNSCPPRRSPACGNRCVSTGASVPFDRRDDRCPARVRRARCGFQPTMADDPLREANDTWERKACVRYRSVWRDRYMLLPIDTDRRPENRRNRTNVQCLAGDRKLKFYASRIYVQNEPRTDARVLSSNGDLHPGDDMDRPHLDAHSSPCFSIHIGKSLHLDWLTKRWIIHAAAGPGGLSVRWIACRG